MKNSRQFIITKIAILTLIVSACGSNKDEVQNSLQIKNVAKVEYRDMPDNIRFNDTFSEKKSFEPNNNQPKIQFDFDLPKGWSEAPKAPFKDLNYSFSNEPTATCYLTVLPLKGGEVLPNLNRWRGQFKLPSLNDIDEQESEIISFLDNQSKLFKLTGDFDPLADKGKNFIAYCLIQTIGENAFTLKFIGPAEFINNEKDNFISLVKSIKITKPQSSENSNASSILPIIPDQIDWVAPDNWTLTEPKPQRIATFRPSQIEGLECYISVFSGNIIDNLNRWRSQMGLEPINNSDNQNLTSFNSDIGSGIYVFLEGKFNGGMSGQAIENAVMAGAIIQGANKTVFVKMVGKKDDVLKEKESFINFIKSLKRVDNGK